MSWIRRRNKLMPKGSSIIKTCTLWRRNKKLWSRVNSGAIPLLRNCWLKVLRHMQLISPAWEPLQTRRILVPFVSMLLVAFERPKTVCSVQVNHLLSVEHGLSGFWCLCWWARLWLIQNLCICCMYCVCFDAKTSSASMLAFYMRLESSFERRRNGNVEWSVTSRTMRDGNVPSWTMYTCAHMIGPRAVI